LLYFILVLKGCCIGVANIIPGVSGGTVAVMLGIYERLIRALHHIGFSTARKLSAILTLKRVAISEARAELHRIDFGFLITITLGALCAVVASARLIVYLLNEQHDPTYGFFFGLVLTSVIIPLKMLKRFTVKECISLLLAAGLTMGLTLSMSGEKRLESEQRKHELRGSYVGRDTITETETSAEVLRKISKGTDHAIGVLLYLCLCSAIAVSAMILPGISGSFIFLLLGVYFDVLAAVDNRDWIVIGVVALGGIVGLLAFTRLLNYVFECYHDLTVSFLVGLMLASLYGLWPFRSYAVVAEVRIDIAHILPQANMNLVITVLAFLIGCGVVFLFHRLEGKRN
jgi:putative membrane protein